jgi:hypothetical protein
MKRQVWKYLCSFFLLLFVFYSLVIFGVGAQYGNFMLETEKHWDTYGVGGTCNHGEQNLFLADADGDGVMEIITGGFTYDAAHLRFEAPLDIWSWDGQNLILEKSHRWDGSTNCVYVADADGDGVNEVFTAGPFRNETGSYSSLRVWHWNGEELSLEAHYEGVSVGSIFVSDVDKDNTPEIITVGGLYGDSQDTVRLCLWRLERNSLILEENLRLDVANVTSAASVYACDLDNNGEVEIVTGGYSDNRNNSKGQLCIWHWNGEELLLKADEKWQMVTGCYALNIAGGIFGNTMVNNLKVGDGDGNGVPEIITGGFTYDGERVNAELIIWSWNGSFLDQEIRQIWTTDYLTEVHGISLDDVDGDSRTDIVNSGMVAAFGSFASNVTERDRGQLRIWEWDGTTLTLKHSLDWTIGEGFDAWNVGTGDLDNDGTVEIVSIGCMSISQLCDPDMRIWSIKNVAADPLFLVFVVAGIIAAIVLSAAIFFVLKKRR